MNTLAVSSLLYFLMSFLSLNDYLKYDNFVETPFDDANTVNTFVYNDAFYCVQNDVIETDSIMYYNLYYIKDKKENSIKLIVPEINNAYPSIRSLHVLDLAVNKDHLCLLTFAYFYIYSISPDNSFTISNIVPIDNTKSLKDVYLGDNNIVLSYDAYFSTVDRSKRNIYLGKLDSYQSKEIKYEYLSQNEYAALTMFQPRKITTYDIRNNLFFVSEILNYKIRIFKDTTLIDSISMNIPTWSDTLSNIIKNKIKDYNSQGFVQAKEIIKHLFKDVDNSYTIKCVQYLKDDKLLVVWGGPYMNNSLNLHFDLWEKINNSWKIKIKDVQIPKYSNDNKLSQNSFLPSSSFDMFDCGKLVCSTNYGLNSFDPKYIDLTTGEFHTLCEKDLENKELKTYYYIFKLDFDK